MRERWFKSEYDSGTTSVHVLYVLHTVVSLLCCGLANLKLLW